MHGLNSTETSLGRLHQRRGGAGDLLSRRMLPDAEPLRRRPIEEFPGGRAALILWRGLAVLWLCAICAGGESQCSSHSVAIVVNKANATEGLSTAQLRRLLLGDLRNWPDRKKVSLITPNPQSSAYKCVLSSVVRMSDAEYRRFIASMDFRGEEPLDMHVAPSDSAAAQMVLATPGGLAIVESSALPAMAASVRILRINGKQPGEAGYPL